MRLPLFLALGVWLLAGCPDSTVSDFVQCTIDVELDASSGPVGATVIATAEPLSSPEDTLVLVDGVRAPIVDVSRVDCAECDACRASVECDACETCTDCADFCAACVQTATFTIPAGAAGETAVVLQNRYGASDPIPFLVEGGDSGDSGTYRGARRRIDGTGWRLPFTGWGRPHTKAP